MNFAKTNALRLANFGTTLVTQFRDGMFILYNKGSCIVTVIIENTKSPMQIGKAIGTKFACIKSTIVGYYLIMDFDTDGWVSMKDFYSSMMKLYKTLRNADYLGNAKSLYIKAICCMKSKSPIENSEPIEFENEK